MGKTTLSPSTFSMEEHFTIQKDHNSHHYYNIITLTNVFKTFDMNFIS